MKETLRCSRKAVLRSIVVMRIVVGIGLVLVMAQGASAERVAPPVAPDDAEAIARAEATSAKREFDRGNHAAAVAHYREAYRLVPTPGLLYNLGQAYRLAGQCSEAADAYRRYLEQVPDSPYRMTAKENMSAAEVCARDLAVRAHGRSAGGATSIAGHGGANDDRDRGSARRRAGMIVGGGGGVLLAGGAYFALDASRAADRVSEAYERGGSWDDVAADDARGRRSRWISGVSLGLGVTAFVGGGALYWTGRRADRTPAIAVGPNAGGGEVVLTWGF
jgi:hypothetical protein